MEEKKRKNLRVNGCVCVCVCGKREKERKFLKVDNECGSNPIFVVCLFVFLLLQNCFFILFWNQEMKGDFVFHERNADGSVGWCKRPSCCCGGSIPLASGIFCFFVFFLFSFAVRFVFFFLFRLIALCGLFFLVSVVLPFILISFSLSLTLYWTGRGGDEM